jgi:hypothetical protein
MTLTSEFARGSEFELMELPGRKHFVFVVPHIRRDLHASEGTHDGV